MKTIKPTIAYVIMLIVVFLDQITKVLTRHFTVEGETFVVWGKLFGETFRFTHLTNTGAAFSIGLSNPLYNRIIFSLIAFIAIGFIIFLLTRVTHRIQVYAFGLVLGGAIGNLIDRVLLGGVTDFIDVDFPDFIMYRWPVFNIADSAVFIAMTLMVIDMIFIREEKAPDPATDLQEKPENS